MEIEELLRLAVETGASDLHLTVNSPPVLRLDGNLRALDAFCAEYGVAVSSSWQRRLAPEDTARIASQLFPPSFEEKFRQTGECDFSFSVAGLSRFRVNVYCQRGSTALAIRPVRFTIPSLKELGLPEVVADFARLPRGLVIVTGPTGSGKSTTLAAMVDLINRESCLHIITIEDPIEFVHHHQKSLVNQREVGGDTLSFAAALRAAMREDPDVILVGEMRDLETMGAAITAAETGHLVLATLHTAGTAQTIDRIIDVFPPYQQQQIRVQLAGTLQGIVAQQLLPRQDRRGRVLAVEVLVATAAARNLIREGKTHQITSLLQSGAKFGMQTMEHSLARLYRAGIISREEALNRALDPGGLLHLLSS